MHSPLERAHERKPKEAIPEPMGDAFRHSSGWVGDRGGSRGAQAEWKNLATSQASTKPWPSSTNCSCPERVLVMTDTSLRQKEPKGPWFICSQPPPSAGLWDLHGPPPQAAPAPSTSPLLYRGLLVSPHQLALSSRSSPCSLCCSHFCEPY